MMDALTKPICPYIYFAGEYTSLEHMNTAHGAYMSGVNAAEQIISKLCDKTDLLTKKHESKSDQQKGEKKNTDGTKPKKANKNKKEDKNKLKDEL